MLVVDAGLSLSTWVAAVHSELDQNLDEPVLMPSVNPTITGADYQLIIDIIWRY